MDEINNQLDDELDAGTSDEDVTDVELDDSDEFEFDDEGNIIIPEVDEETGDTEEENAAEEQEENSEEPSDKETEPVTKDAESAEKPAPAPEPDARDEENARLKAQVAEYERLAKSALSKMGVNAKDGKSALIKLAAEAEGISEEEYVKKHAEDAKNEEARRFMQAAKFNEKKARDLAAVQAAYPDAKKYKDVEEFPNFKRFAYLCDHGSTPEEAYIAAHRMQVAESVAQSVKQQSLNGTKDHIKSTVPKGAKNNQTTMTKAELSQWKDMFPHLSTKEIIALYRKTK